MDVSLATITDYGEHNRPVITNNNDEVACSSAVHPSDVRDNCDTLRGTVGTNYEYEKEEMINCLRHGYIARDYVSDTAGSHISNTVRMFQQLMELRQTDESLVVEDRDPSIGIVCSIAILSI